MRQTVPGPLAQLVEQVTFNHRVVGSSPTRPTNVQGSGCTVCSSEPWQFGRLLLVVEGILNALHRGRTLAVYGMRVDL